MIFSLVKVLRRKMHTKESVEKPLQSVHVFKINKMQTRALISMVDFTYHMSYDLSAVKH